MLVLTPFVLVVVSAVTNAQSGLAPKKFLSLPLGAITPTGWLHDQLMVQTNGLAGHEHEFYDYVAQTDWVGGDSYYSYLEEAGSYWFNGMVPNGVLVNDTTIKSQTQQFLDYVLDHQDETGWLGPEVNTTKPRYLWGRYPFFFGAIQMVEADPSLTDRVVTAFYKFISLANTMLHNGEGLEEWAETRWEDFVITLQWLYDLHPNSQEDLLIDTMKMLKWTGDPWESVFDEQYFPTGPVEDLENPFPVLTWHGVNMAEGLKALPATYRFTHNQSVGDQIVTDMWSRQYLQEQNQIAAQNMTPNPFPEDGPYSNVFGLEPNYPCCTVNHPQGWPKFISNSFLTTPDQESLVHLYLGPFSTQTTLAGGNTVSASVDTLYPFGDTLTTTIMAEKAFTYYVRIPSWVTNGTITVNGGSAQPVSPQNGLHAVKASAGITKFILNLPAEIMTGKCIF
ncbi:hypothetical protein EWM64_g6740 [Hericium alpestre]|uniref:Non-reducing end beta-L-arabinofuranosidase-like GH127 middle domain-containing protein n=1 Tax=Hericium alpestre TaxID=135208 RepID=A0A4Y9ZTB4_9AGAM|nr:hypothetical protein EWM64_g6740 [Hericium alpestre]